MKRLFLLVTALSATVAGFCQNNGDDLYYTSRKPTVKTVPVTQDRQLLESAKAAKGGAYDQDYYPGMFEDLLAGKDIPVTEKTNEKEITRLVYVPVWAESYANNMILGMYIPSYFRWNDWFYGPSRYPFAAVYGGYRPWYSHWDPWFNPYYGGGYYPWFRPTYPYYPNYHPHYPPHYNPQPPRPNYRNDRVVYSNERRGTGSTVGGYTGNGSIGREIYRKDVSDRVNGNGNTNSGYNRPTSRPTTRPTTTPQREPNRDYNNVIRPNNNTNSNSTSSYTRSSSTSSSSVGSSTGRTVTNSSSRRH